MFVSTIHDALPVNSLPNTETERPRDRPAREPAPEALKQQGSETRKQGEETAAKVAGEDVRAAAAERLKQRFEEIQDRGYLRELRLEHEILDSGRIVVKIHDARTDKVIRTLPPEDQLAFSERLEDTLGLLFDEQV